MRSEPIPFLDLVTPHKELAAELTEVFTQVLTTGRFIGGPMVESFESNFAAYSDAKYCIGLNSGTDAVRFALIAAGIRQGDVALTVPNTFIATVEGISQAGAIAEFVEINEATFSMDPEKIRTYIADQCMFDSKSKLLISKRSQRPVRALVPVHLYGQMADMDPIMEIAEQYNLVVVEDACQAHGARYFSKRANKWLVAGSVGDAGAFSFYPGKNLGAMGEGGAVTTNSDTIDRVVRMLRDHGQIKKYIHEIEGYNGRLDAMQAGFLAVKLQHLKSWTKQRQDAAHYYSEKLQQIANVTCMSEPSWAEAVFHLFVVRVPNRAKVMECLDKESIGMGLHYPIPLHLQVAYRHLHYRQGDFPVSEKIAGEILSLPMYPGLTSAQQDRIIAALKTAL